MKCWPLLILFLLGSVPLAAQQSQRFGDYEVFYSFTPTTMLRPEVARAHALERAPNRWLLNIAVRQGAEGSIGSAVRATVEVEARNLLGQVSKPQLQEVVEGEARYHLGSMRVAHQELWRFDVRVVPEGVARPLQLRFEWTTDTSER